MMNIPKELKYTTSHEWVKKIEDNTYYIGITEYAQKLIGDIVYVEFPEIGTILAIEENCATIESVKSASDIYMPVSGKIIMINEVLKISPEIINTSPYIDGWLLKIKASNPPDVDLLLSANSYSKIINNNI